MRDTNCCWPYLHYSFMWRIDLVTEASYPAGGSICKPRKHTRPVSKTKWEVEALWQQTSQL